MNKSLSVLIVNYNAGDYLRRCVQSVLDNAADINLEIIIVDNHSLDGSIDSLNDLLVKHENLFIIKNQNNVGFACAVNQALSKAAGDYVLLLNPDCYVFSDTFNKLITVYESQSDIGLVGASVFNEDGSEQRGGRRREPTLWRSIVTIAGLEKYLSGINLHHQPYPESPLEVDAVSGAAMLIKRDFFLSLGGMDENYFLHCEDLDLCQMVRKAGMKVYYATNAVVMHKQGVSGVASNVVVEQHKHDGMSYYYKKHYAKNRLQQSLMQVLIAVRMYLIKLKQHFVPSVSDCHQHESAMLPCLNNLKTKLIVTGGRSDVGDSLIDLLEQRHEIDSVDIIFVSRRPVNKVISDNQKVRWLHVDFLKHLAAKDIGHVIAWVNLAPVWTSSDFADKLLPLKPARIIAISSTSILTKAQSEDVSEQELVRKLTNGESQLKQLAEKIPVFILRPTMIYGGCRNRNVNVISAIIKYTGMFPIVGDGTALRQPVHCEDVAWACLALVEMHAKVGVSCYNLPGNEQLSYRQLVQRVFQQQGRKVRFIRVPLVMAKLLLRFLGWLPGMSMISTQAANRMQQDLVFSVEDAKHDFNFTPRNFKP